MTADYDPLALPAAYFEGVPNNVPGQPEPVEKHQRNGQCGGECSVCACGIGPYYAECPCCHDAAHCADFSTQQHTPAGGARQ